jgi:hypothetical protein
LPNSKAVIFKRLNSTPIKIPIFPKMEHTIPEDQESQQPPRPNSPRNQANLRKLSIISPRKSSNNVRSPKSKSRSVFSNDNKFADGDYSLEFSDDEDGEGDLVQIGNSEITELRLTKHRSGWINRFFRLGDPHSPTKLLSFKKTPIRKALLKLNRKFDKLCVEYFRNIMAFMGDREVSNSKEEHAQILIGMGLRAEEDSLRDEIALQICKQINSHPKLEGAIRGWELLTMVCASFVVSKPLREFLAEFVKGVLQDDDTDKLVAQLAKSVIQRMNACTIRGNRLKAPSIDEIKTDLDGRKFIIAVKIGGEIFRNFEVDSFTLIREVLGEIIQRSCIRFEWLFTLYCAGLTADKYLNYDTRVLDEYSAWQDALSHFVDENMKDFVLIFKAEVIPFTSDPKLQEDLDALKLIQKQTAISIAKGDFMKEDIDFGKLAAWQLQIDFGDYDDSRTKVWFETTLQKILPKSAYKDKSSIELGKLYQEVKMNYISFKSSTAALSRFSYISLVDKDPLYGSNIFLIEQSSCKKFPSELRISFGLNGIFLLHKKKREILEEILWENASMEKCSDSKQLILKWKDFTMKFPSLNQEGIFRIYRKHQKYIGKSKEEMFD